VVPYVRGREISRKPERIINEIKMLVANGASEITLLGQNVNSYGKKNGTITFAKLIELVNEIEGLKRIRFTTSHPKDLGDDLIEAFKKFDKLCPHIHLPVQSGSDAVLKRMNRQYKIKDYIEKIENLRKSVSNISITSDFIVGFCQETEEDFNMTLDLIKNIEFDGIFAFAYSPRPNAASRKFKDITSEKEKKERLYRLLKLQEYYTKKKNKELVGTIQKTLADGLSKRGLFQNEKKEWTGRTDTNKIVNFITSKDYEPIGKIVNVKIEKAFSHSLWGIL
jgi:tRNA-2-methylthio-N6-dimethylallyladenosine synthase